MSNYRFKDYVPKLISCLKEGYSTKYFFNDLFAGMSVGVIALPLSLAFAIGSDVAPERGLFTAIIGGFLISLLGGSRVQIGGPAGAFVIVVYTIIQKHGYDGLAVATIIAGILLILMGLARFGVLLKFIPFPVTAGFTTGLALSIFISQIKDFFGLQIDKVPPQFIEKCTIFCYHAHTWNQWAFVVSSITLALIFALRRYFPKIPGVIVAIILATAICSILNLPLETIESKFGEIPRVLPTPKLPSFSYEMIKKVFPDAITIAMLVAIESLLTAVVADGMTGHKHRSNCELVAQGFANIGSILFGGIPATGTIARTTANIKMGAKTPIAGMIHAVTLLLIMVLLAPLVGKIPLSALSAVLVYVAWNMSDLSHFIEILKSQKSEALILLITFFLTVLIDLTVAVQVGVVLSAMIFVQKMADNTSVKICRVLLDENNYENDEASDGEILFRKDIPEDFAVIEINGPFFYSVADLLNETLAKLDQPPRVFILRMRKVPIIDTTGLRALKEFKIKCDKQGILFLLSGVSEKMREKFENTSVKTTVGRDHIFLNFDTALAYAKKHLLKGLSA